MDYSKDVIRQQGSLHKALVVLVLLHTCLSPAQPDSKGACEMPRPELLYALLILG